MPSKQRKLRKRWEELYGKQEAVRRYFKEAYLGAAAPVLAGMVALQQKPTVNVLVVGGGKGRFTTELLPEAKRVLRERGIDTKIQVVESDIAPIIRRIPPSQAVRTDVSTSRSRTTSST